MRSTAVYTMYDHKLNEKIRKELNRYNLNKIIVDYRLKRTFPLRMTAARIASSKSEYISTGTKRRRSTKVETEIPTAMKTEKANNGLYPAVDDDNKLTWKHKNKKLNFLK
jgi:hypothetical protein